MAPCQSARAYSFRCIERQRRHGLIHHFYLCNQSVPPIYTSHRRLLASAHSIEGGGGGVVVGGTVSTVVISLPLRRVTGPGPPAFLTSSEACLAT
jgi:hypothetical protein